MKKTVFATLLLTLFSIQGLLAQDKQSKSIHVDFVSTVDEGMTINMTLPLSFLESFQPKIEEFLHEVQYNDHQINFAAIWQAAREAGPTDFVEVNSDDADVRVSTTETHLIIKVLEKREGHDIEVTVPLALGDALFANLENLDYDRIAAALLTMDGQDLVRITSEEINGRIWIE
jgi:hypothetical protein